MYPNATPYQKLLLWLINKIGDHLIKDDKGDTSDNRMAVFFTRSGKVSNILLTAYGTDYDLINRFSEEEELDQIPVPAPKRPRPRKAKPKARKKA